jgi:hypothetical protein
MPPRVLSLFLAVVMLLSGFAAAEQAVTGPAQNLEQGAERTLEEASNDVRGGVIDDDRADDLPAQPQAESAQDPLLPGALCVAAAPALSLAWPHGSSLAALLSPFLEGPQRPPCSTGIPA